MESKWFKIYEKNKTFKSKRKAQTNREMWDKTLKKWCLKMEGFESIGRLDTCGLCDCYFEKCSVCPASYTYFGQLNKRFASCVPFADKPDLEYLFLLIVREATKK